jgi:hypothetical protein
MAPDDRLRRHQEAGPALKRRPTGWAGTATRGAGAATKKAAPAKTAAAEKAAAQAAVGKKAPTAPQKAAGEA